MPLRIHPMRKSLARIEKELNDYSDLARDHAKYSSENRARLQDISADLNWAAIAVSRALSLLRGWKKTR